MIPMIALSMPGGPEWIFIVALLVLLFGAKKIPELARGLGQSFGEFRKARDEFERELHKSADEPKAEEKKEPAPAETPKQIS